MRWYGHVIRLPEETPAKLALKEARRKVKKLRGGQTTTWLAVLEKDLDALSLTLDRATELAFDRDAWRGVVWKTRAPCAIRTSCVTEERVGKKKASREVGIFYFLIAYFIN